MKILKVYLKVLWYLLLTLPLIFNLWNHEKMAKNWGVFSKITASIVFQNFILIVVVFSAFMGLIKIAPFLKWSWFSLFTKNDPESGKSGPYEGTNINLIPAKTKYFGLVYLILFAINLPIFAHIEEVWFRQGTHTWQDGILLSILFGLAHCLVGVPIGAGMAISLTGLWLTHQYFIGGVELSTVHHTTYNLILIFMLFLTLILDHIFNFSEEKT